MRSTISKMIDLKVLGSILFLLNICSFNTALITNRSLIVETAEGLVSGEEFIGKSQKTWYRYRGIPFAEPPVGDLRFEVSILFILIIIYIVNIINAEFSYFWICLFSATVMLCVIRVNLRCFSKRNKSHILRLR